jgi:hypothetical protein
LSGEKQEDLAWPPRPEDLRRLYIDEGLSAAKIAVRYGLKYASPKTAESTVLYHLKRNGITRRDKADHIRKVTEEMVDGWVKRYEEGESLKDIADGPAEWKVDPVTVFNHLRKRGLQLRDKVEAQIEAVTIHEKKPFRGDLLEAAYLLGFLRGDAWVVTHGRAIRVRAGSTHPDFLTLFRGLFEEYGHIYLYPKEAQLTGYEWSMDVDLDKSFEFLLNRDANTFERIIAEQRLFLSYLAGFFDAEGSIYYHKKGTGGAFEMNITNMDYGLLTTLCDEIRNFGHHAKLSINTRDNKKSIIKGADQIWRIEIWRHEDVTRLLGMLPLRHPEKTAKKAIALQLPDWPSKEARQRVMVDWNSLLQRIEQDVQKSISCAKKIMEEKRSVASLNEPNPG